MRQFLYILLLAVMTAGCSDNQATVEGESKATRDRQKPADDLQSNSKEPGVNVDTIGMAEFLALKALEADENDISDDTTGFSAFKKSKAKAARQPCDCADSIKADDDAETSDQAEVTGEAADTVKKGKSVTTKRRVQ